MSAKPTVRVATILVAAFLAAVCPCQQPSISINKVQIVDAMRAREQAIRNFDAIVREKDSSVSPQAHETGSSNDLKLKHNARDLHYRFQSTQNQFRFADLDPSPEDGHKGVIVFDGRYKLSFQLAKNPADEKYQIGIMTKGVDDWYSPMLLGFWSPAEDSPLGPHRASWSDLLATAEIQSGHTAIDPIFGQALQIEFKLADGRAGKLWLSVKNGYLPFRASWSTGSKGNEMGFDYDAKAFKVISGVPVVTSATCGDYFRDRGIDIQSQHRSYDLQSVRVNNAKFAIDFSLPESSRFDNYIPGEQQGHYVVQKGQLVLKEAIYPTSKARGNDLVLLGIIVAAIILAIFVVLYLRALRRATKQNVNPGA